MMIKYSGYEIIGTLTVSLRMSPLLTVFMNGGMIWNRITNMIMLKGSVGCF